MCVCIYTDKKINLFKYIILACIQTTVLLYIYININNILVYLQDYFAKFDIRH